MSGILYGVGLGPGDPELITLKAARLIESADRVCYIQNPEGYSMAREIAEAHLNRGQAELPMVIRMGRDRVSANQAYDRTAEALRPALAAGETVVMLCEGDPLLYGSFIYLFERLCSEFTCEVVPGISALNAVASRVRRPLSRLNQSVTLITARASDAEILRALADHDSLAIFKAGPQRERLLKLIRESGRWADGCYVERATRSDEQIYPSLDELPDAAGDYFGLLLITRGSGGQGSAR